MTQKEEVGGRIGLDPSLKAYHSRAPWGAKDQSDDIDEDFTNCEFLLNQNERIRIEIKTTLHQLLLPIDHWLQLVSNATATRR